MNEKEIFFQILERYIDNTFRRIENPIVNLFENPIKNWIINFCDPYIDAFTMSDSDRINTKAAKEFLKSEINEKIEKFMKEFEESRS